MAQSKTEIANLALGHIGISKPIGDFATERSVEAQMMRTYYETAYQATLRAVPWTFAKKFASLALVTDFTTQTVPTTLEWFYSYRYPSDCFHFVRIVSPRLNNDTRQSRIPYTIAADASGLLIYSNFPNPSETSITPMCEYTFLNTNIAQYPPDFVMAMSYLLGFYCAPALTKGDPFKLGAAAGANFKTMILQAANMFLNEEQRPEEPQSEFIRARDGDPLGMAGQNWSPLADGFVVE